MTIYLLIEYMIQYFIMIAKSILILTNHLIFVGDVYMAKKANVLYVLLDKYKDITGSNISANIDIDYIEEDDLYIIIVAT